MKTLTVRLLTFFCLMAQTLPVRAADHPRIYVDRVPAIRAALADPSSHHALVIADMKKAVANPDASAAYEEHIEAYTLSYRAREAAFLCLIAENPAEKKKYAEIAYDLVKNDYNRAERKAYDGYGLSRAMMSVGLGLTYDWFYEQWTPKQRAAIKKQIDRALDAWPKYGHANLRGHRGSNWAAVCFGGELILILGAGEETARADRVKRLKRNLKQHMKTAYGDIGYSQEGIGYTEYGGNFLWRAVLVSKSVGDTDLFDAAKAHKWWTWFMYAGAFVEWERKFVQSGVSHGSNYNEGAASLQLGLVDEKNLPYVLYWYERHMGRKNPLMTRRFDGDRAARVDAAAWYPTGIDELDPTGTFPPVVADKKGYVFFRNRWKDADDIMISMHADTSSHSHSWDKPEVGAINILAFNTRFIGGPGKTGGSRKKDPKHALFSTLLVDGRYFANVRKAPKNGKMIAVEPSPVGGSVVVDGGKQYEAMGVKSYQRQAFVDFSLSGKAIFSTLDTIDGGKDRTYTWQANIGSDRDGDGVKVATGEESGLPMFILSGRKNSSVKGWVIHPRNAKIKANGGKPLQISTKGNQADIWVLMWVGQGTAPTIQVQGDGLQTLVRLDGKTIVYDAVKQRIHAQ